MKAINIKMLLNNLSKPTACAVMLAAISLYFFAVGKLAVDFPCWDDFNAVLEPTLKMEASNTYSEKLGIILAPHNEHRIAFARVVEFLLFKLQGRVDFRVLIWAGNLGLVALCVAVMLGAPKTIPWHLLAIVPLLIFSPLQGYQMIWAMACLSNFWAMAFAVWSLFLLTGRGNIAFGGACLLAVAASFTSGQGIVCFIPGVAALLLQRRWRRTLIWSGVFVLTALVYFKGFARPSYLEISLRSAVFFPIVTGDAVSAPIWPLLSSLTSFLGFGGGRLNFAFRAFVGLGILGLIGYVWLKGYYRRNLFVCVLLLYLVGLCAAAALSRSGFGLKQATDDHYHIVSLLIAIGLVLSLADMYCAKPNDDSFKVFVLTGTAFLSLVLWHQFLPGVRAFSAQLNQSRQLFIESQDPQAVLWPTPQDYGTDLLWQSYLTGLMQLKDFDYSRTVTLSPSRLQRIGTLESSEPTKARSPQLDRGSRVVARLEWHHDALALYPVDGSGEFPNVAGWIAVRKGKLFYALPAE